jgi:hypothetical protein
MPFDLDEFLQGARLGRYRQPAPETQPEPVPRPPLVSYEPLPVAAAPEVSELTPADAPRLLRELEEQAAALCGAGITAVEPGLLRVRELLDAAFGAGDADPEAQLAAQAALPAALDDVEDLMEACALIAR